MTQILEKGVQAPDLTLRVTPDQTHSLNEFAGCRVAPGCFSREPRVAVRRSPLAEVHPHAADFIGGVRSGVIGTRTFFIHGARYDDTNGVLDSARPSIGSFRRRSDKSF